MSVPAIRTPYVTLPAYSPEAFNTFGAGHLPGHLGVEVLSTNPGLLVCRVPIRAEIMAPNGQPSSSLPRGPERGGSPGTQL